MGAKMRTRIIVVIALFVAVAGAVLLYSRYSDTRDYQYDTIENICKVAKKDIDRITDRTYSNLDLSNVYVVPFAKNTDQVFLFHAIRNNSWKENERDGLIKRTAAIGKAIWKQDLMPAKEPEKTDQNLTWEVGDYWISLGATSLYIEDTKSESVESSGTVREYYRINESMETGDVVLKQDSYPLKDAIQYAENVVHKYLADYVWTDDIRLRTVIKAGLSDGTEQYILRFEYVVNGIALDEAGDYVHQGNGGTLLPAWLEIRMNGKEHINSIRCNAFAMQEKQKMGKKLLTLSGALHAVSDELAPYGKYDISSIELKYGCLYPEMEGETPDDEEIRYLPMWVFQVDSDKKNADISPDPANLDPRMNLYVDAVSGKVYILDSTNISSKYFTLKSE